MIAGDLLSNIPPSFYDVGAKGLLALTVIMILTGRLVPGKERDHWRDMALELVEQNRKLLIGAETTNHVLRSLPTQEEER